MAEDSKIEFSKVEQENLQHLSDLLHLFYHRNKNQHRRSIWWRHFSIFRRQLNGLLEEIQTLKVVPTTHLARTRKKSRDKETQLKISQRLGFWRDVMVPKWQNSFSQVVADGRFATLGLIITAALAQACQVTGITAIFEDVGQVEVEKVLEQFGRETSDGEAMGGDHQPGMEEDLGEVVLRHEEGNSQDGKFAAPVFRVDDDEATTGKKLKRTATPSQKPRKRKRGDAIDDIFNEFH